MGLFVVDTTVCRKEERKGQPPEKENPPSKLYLPSSELAEEAGEGGEQHGSPCHPAETAGLSQVRSREEREISLLHKVISHAAHSKCASWSHFVPRSILCI